MAVMPVTETQQNGSHNREGIKVSILITTYNHEKYVRQTLDSALNQSVDFKYEILVGDDASQDATPHILREYTEKYQQIVHIFLHDKNLGASRNNYELLQQARGEYIATLDGDDFWTDSEKLKVQAEFLDAHPEFIGCTHECRIVNEDGSPSDVSKLSWISDKKIFSLKDFKGFILPGHPSSMMKRNIFKTPNNDYSILYKAHPMICDRTGMLLYLAEGNFFRIDRRMSAYRRIRKKHGDNLTSTLYVDDSKHLYNDYMFTCRLQEYAANELHIDGGFESRKRELFAGAACRSLLKPNGENINMLKEMLAKAKCPAFYLLALPYNVLKKLYTKFIYK